MKKVFVLFILLTSFFKANAQEGKIEKEWVKEDSIFISSYIHAFKTNPLKIEGFLEPVKKWQDNLGFGYTSIEGSMGKGYVTVFYQLIYFNGKLVSYKLKPQMPKDTRLTERYKRFYSPLYRFDKSGNPHPLYYKYAEMAKPLEGYYKGTPDRGKSYLMTPFSGVVYGNRGGIAMEVIDNRVAYNNVKENLTPEDYLMLLYSKNPATRLVAAEFYIRNPKSLKNYKSEIESRLRVIYQNHPETKTISGCNVSVENSKELVNFYAKEGKKYSK